MTADPITEALAWIKGQIIVDRTEARAKYRHQADALLDGLLSQGYVRHRNGEFDVSPQGERRLADKGTQLQ